MAFTSQPDPAEIIKVESRVFVNPTNKASQATWGTMLGFAAAGVKLYPNKKIYIGTQEDTGEIPVKFFNLLGSPFLTVPLLNFNTGVLEKIFKGMVSGTTVNFPGSVKVGIEIAALDNILVVPADLDNHPCVYLKNATSNIEPSRFLEMSHVKDTTFMVTFYGKSYYFGSWAGLSI